MRVIASYLRLATTFLLGVALVRLLILLGDEVYGLIVLLGAGVGLALIVREVAQTSLVPCLGAAWHRGPIAFQQTYHSAQVIALVGSAVSLLCFAVLALQVQWLNMPPELAPAARWFLFFKAIQVGASVALAPVCTMNLVCERMVFYNLVVLLERASEVVAAAAVWLILGSGKATSAVVAYAATSSCLTILVLSAAALLTCYRDPRLRPGIRFCARDDVAWILKSSTAVAILFLSFSLYIRFDTFVMNHYFALAGSLAFGTAVQLTGYVRIMTNGVVVGLDAVSARVTATRSSEATRGLLERTTRLQALIVLPLSVLFLVFADEFARLFLGSNLRAGQQAIDFVAALTRWLIVGTAARSLTEGWIQVLIGAGKIPRAVGILFLGACINLVLVALVTPYLPASLGQYAPAALYALLMGAVNFIGLPRIVARFCDTSAWSIVTPVLRPGLLTCLCAIWLAPLVNHPERWTGLAPVLLAGAFLGSYALLAYALVLRADERVRMMGMATPILRLARRQPAEVRYRSAA